MSGSSSLIQELDGEIIRQNKWRVIMSTLYFVTSAVAIISSGAATVVAGLGDSTSAAYLAGAATVLFGLEKAMLFREKCAHHLSTATQLKAARLGYKYGEISEQEIAARVGTILTEYAVKLPIAERSVADQDPKKGE